MPSKEEEDLKVKEILKNDPKLKQEHDALYKKYQETKMKYIAFRQKIISSSNFNTSKTNRTEEELAKLDNAKKFIQREILSDELKTTVIKRMIKRQAEMEKELERQYRELPEDARQEFYIRSHAALENLSLEFCKVFAKFKIPFFTEKNEFKEQRMGLVMYMQREVGLP